MPLLSILIVKLETETLAIFESPEARAISGRWASCSRRRTNHENDTSEPCNRSSSLQLRSTGEHRTPMVCKPYRSEKILVKANELY